MFKEFRLSSHLFIRVKQSIKHNFRNQDFDEYAKFVDELPHNLKIEVSMYIHDETYKIMVFLKEK